MSSKIILILIPLLFSLFSCDKRTQELETVRIAANRDVAWVLIYVAEEMGFFREEGIDLLIDEGYEANGTKMMAGLIAGELDVVHIALYPFVAESLERDDIRLVSSLLSAYAGVSIVARKSSGIEKGSDLVGKRVGVTMNTNLHFLLDSTLVYHKVLPEEVEIIDAIGDDMPALLQLEELDAVLTTEPYTSRIFTRLGDDVSLLKTDFRMITYLSLVTMGSFTQTNPETLEKLLRAFDKTSRFLHSGTDEPVALIGDIFGLESQTVEYLISIMKVAIEMDQVLLVRMANEARWMIKQNYTDTENIPDYYNYMYLDASNSHY